MMQILILGDYLQRFYAIIGHRAPSSGKLNLNDLSGSGRMDVLVRAINSTLFISHGIRNDSKITLHLQGGEGPNRRILFDGATLAGVRPDERSIAGQIKAIMKLPIPPVGHFQEVTQGIFHSGGDISDTINSWNKEEIEINILDTEGTNISKKYNVEKIGFVLSDDLPFTNEEKNILKSYQKISLGKKWLQGHSCIAISQYELDKNLI
jgi:tRNA (pseudouridine54-N1)-methyltransferase